MKFVESEYRLLSMLLVLLMALAAIFMGIMGVKQAEASVSSQVVISEFFYDETGVDNNEFVELYNPTGTVVDISAWRIEHYNQVKVEQNILIIPSSTTIAPFSYYLIGEKDSLNSVDWGGVAVIPDLVRKFFRGPSDEWQNGGIALKNSAGVVIDSLQWGEQVNDSGVGEGTPAVDMPEGQSLERKANDGSDPTSVGAGKGNGWDTDDNANDFVASTPNPQNSLSPAEPFDGGGDSTPPAKQTNSPVAFATGVGIDTPVSVTFDEAIQLGSKINDITIKDADNQLVSGIATNVSGSALTVNHAGLTYGTTYTVNVPAGAVKDVAGNETTVATTWSFTTAAGETVVTVPDASGIISSTGNTAEIEISIANATGMAGGQFELRYNATIAVVSGIVVGEVLNGFTFESNLNNAATGLVEVGWAAAEGATVAGGILFRVILELQSAGTTDLLLENLKLNDETGTLLLSRADKGLLTVITDTTAPVMQSILPANNATNVAIDAVVSVTFDEAIQPSSKISDITIKDAVGQSVSGITTSISGNKLNIGHADFAYDTTYTVTVPTGAIKDAAGNVTVSVTTWSFTTVARKGDLNSDGEVTAADATLALRAAVGLISLSSEQVVAADVNGDGVITAADATLLLRYAINLIDSFPR